MNEEILKEALKRAKTQEGKRAIAARIVDLRNTPQTDPVIPIPTDAETSSSPISPQVKEVVQSGVDAVKRGGGAVKEFVTDDIPQLAGMAVDAGEAVFDKYRSDPKKMLSNTGLAEAAFETAGEKLGQSFVDDPQGTVFEGGRMGTQAVVGAAFPPASPLTVPLAGKAYDHLISATTDEERFDKDLSFDGLSQDVEDIYEETVKGAVIPGALKSIGAGKRAAASLHRKTLGRPARVAMKLFGVEKSQIRKITRDNPNFKYESAAVIERLHETAPEFKQLVAIGNKEKRFRGLNALKRVHGQSISDFFDTNSNIRVSSQSVRKIIEDAGFDSSNIKQFKKGTQSLADKKALEILDLELQGNQSVSLKDLWDLRKMADDEAFISKKPMSEVSAAERSMRKLRNGINEALERKIDVAVGAGRISEDVAEAYRSSSKQYADYAYLEKPFKEQLEKSAGKAFLIDESVNPIGIVQGLGLVGAYQFLGAPAAIGLAATSGAATSYGLSSAFKLNNLGEAMSNAGGSPIALVGSSLATQAVGRDLGQPDIEEGLTAMAESLSPQPQPAPTPQGITEEDLAGMQEVMSQIAPPQPPAELPRDSNAIKENIQDVLSRIPDPVIAEDYAKLVANGGEDEIADATIALNQQFPELGLVKGRYPSEFNGRIRDPNDRVKHDEVLRKQLASDPSKGKIVAKQRSLLNGDGTMYEPTEQELMKPVKAKIAPDEGRGFVQTAMQQAGITDPVEAAQFLGQLSHESMGFTRLKEIASGAKYEGKEILGNTQPGDGEKYKGRGFIQLTGRYNYEYFGKVLGLDLVGNPELAAQPEVAAQIAVEYWNQRVKPHIDDYKDTKSITRLINGGYNGLEDRTRRVSGFMTDNEDKIKGKVVTALGSRNSVEA